MGFKSVLFSASITALCSMAINHAHAASVWSTGILVDEDLSAEWQLHIITSDSDLVDPSQITGAYIDSIVFNTIDPSDLLTTTPYDLALLDMYDWATINGVDDAGFTSISTDVLGNPNIFVLDNFSAFGTQLAAGDGAIGCITIDCGVSLRKPSGDFSSILRPISLQEITLTRTALSAVPVPAAAWLFGSGLIGLIGIARRKKA